MGSSRRITIALVGLVLLVLAGWFAQSRLADEPPPSHPPAVTTEAPADRR